MAGVKHPAKPDVGGRCSGPPGQHQRLVVSLECNWLILTQPVWATGREARQLVANSGCCGSCALGVNYRVLLITVPRLVVGRAFVRCSLTDCAEQVSTACQLCSQLDRSKHDGSSSCSCSPPVPAAQ